MRCHAMIGLALQKHAPYKLRPTTSVKHAPFAVEMAGAPADEASVEGEPLYPEKVVNIPEEVSPVQQSLAISEVAAEAASTSLPVGDDQTQRTEASQVLSPSSLIDLPKTSMETKAQCPEDEQPVAKVSSDAKPPNTNEKDFDDGKGIERSSNQEKLSTEIFWTVLASSCLRSLRSTCSSTPAQLEADRLREMAQQSRCGTRRGSS